MLFREGTAIVRSLSVGPLWHMLGQLLYLQLQLLLLLRQVSSSLR